jgi:hypothetical protein
MERIVFYLNTKDFGIGSFNGFETLKDFYCSTILSMILTSNLHPLKPLITKLVTDQKGRELLIDKNLVNIDEIYFYHEETYSRLRFYEEEFPALHVNLNVFAFYDLPLNHYASDFLCFNKHYNNNLHVDLAKKMIKLIGNSDDPIITDIKKAIKSKKVYSLNTSIIGTNLSGLMSYLSAHIRHYHKNTNDPVFVKFIESVYLYYYLMKKNIIITYVNPYIPENEYIDFKFFLTERLSIFILGDKAKKNKLVLHAIEKTCLEKEPLLYSKLQTQ